MTNWKRVDHVSLEGVAYNGPAWIRTAEDKRGVYSSVLTAVVPIDTTRWYLPFVHGIDKGGNANLHGGERAFGTVASAKQHATLRLQAQSGGG